MAAAIPEIEALIASNPQLVSQLAAAGPPMQNYTNMQGGIGGGDPRLAAGMQLAQNKGIQWLTALIIVVVIIVIIIVIVII